MQHIPGERREILLDGMAQCKRSGRFWRKTGLQKLPVFFYIFQYVSGPLWRLTGAAQGKRRGKTNRGYNPANA
jgi:hypothetical protein